MSGTKPAPRGRTGSEIVSPPSVIDVPIMTCPADFQVMPDLTDEEYAALRADIAERGVMVPVLVDQHGRTLDGHHRQQVAAELGIRCPQEVRLVASDDEARDVALTLNLTRRHLTREQRRELVAREIEARPGDSDRAIARRFGCSPSTVGAVREPQVSKLDTQMTADEAEFPVRLRRIQRETSELVRLTAEGKVVIADGQRDGLVGGTS